MKKGLSIIELLISMSLISIIMVYEITVFARCIHINRKGVIRQEANLYVEEAFDIIKNEIDICDYIRINGNSITICKEDGIAEDRIELKPENNLVIEYKGEYPQSIALCIKKFDITLHKRVLYIDITDTSGRKYERCYIIKNIK